VWIVCFKLDTKKMKLVRTQKSVEQSQNHKNQYLIYININK
jgi:hypothetical protein